MESERENDSGDSDCDNEGELRGPDVNEEDANEEEAGGSDRLQSEEDVEKTPQQRGTAAKVVKKIIKFISHDNDEKHWILLRSELER